MTERHCGAAKLMLTEKVKLKQVGGEYYEG
jgi:hypothetical protein